MKKYYFRVDGGDVYCIATGHIMRCLKLADFISMREKAEIYFIMKNYKDGIGLVGGRYRVLLIDKDLNIKDETKNINNNLEKENLINVEEEQNQMAFVGGVDKKNKNSFNKWLFLLIAIMVLSSVGAIFSKKPNKKSEDNTEDGELKAEDFKIIE